jgi:asparagine synthetase B (glutamine-hydrolysing)
MSDPFHWPAQRIDEDCWVVDLRAGADLRDWYRPHPQIPLFSREPLKHPPATLHTPDGWVVVQGDVEGGPAEVLRAIRLNASRSLKGRFVAIGFDAHEERHVVLRDATGRIPLFRVGEELFSPSIVVLREHPRVTTKPDPLALAEWMLYRFPEPGRTLWEGIRRIAQGGRIQIVRGRLTEDRWWELPPEQEVRWRGVEEVERFPELLDESVARSLHGAERAAIFLSSGIDSASVAASAIEQVRARGGLDPVALSLWFQHPQSDESVSQRAIAESLQMEHVLLPFDESLAQRELIDAALAALGDFPLPALNTWMPAYAGLAAHGLRAGAGLMLTGTGGDEWMGVAPELAADLIRHGRFLALARFVAAQRRSYVVPLLSTARIHLWSFGMRPLLGAWVGAHLPPSLLRARRASRMRRKIPRWLAPDKALREAIVDRERWLSPPPTRGDFYYARGCLATMQDDGSAELEEQYEFGLRIGLPVRMPFYDPEFVEFLATVHPDTLLSGGRAKGLGRLLVAKRFPHLDIARDRKTVATEFHTQRLVASLPALRARFGRRWLLDELGVIDQRHLDLVLDPATITKGRGAWQAWNLINTESWLRCGAAAPGLR